MRRTTLPNVHSIDHDRDQAVDAVGLRQGGGAVLGVGSG
jgi:hypothetical protein